MPPATWRAGSGGRSAWKSSRRRKLSRARGFRVQLVILVIGSGPAGVACATALLDGGEKVTMLDAGLELKPDRRRQVANLQSMPSTSWAKESVGCLRDGGEATPEGIPMKPAYGSDFAYRNPTGQPITSDGAYGKPSFARGGVSKVGGGSGLPPRTHDKRSWAIH